jgi:hypothetical protein
MLAESSNKLRLHLFKLNLWIFIFTSSLLLWSSSCSATTTDKDGDATDDDGGGGGGGGVGVINFVVFIVEGCFAAGDMIDQERFPYLKDLAGDGIVLNSYYTSSLASSFLFDKPEVSSQYGFLPI